MRKNTRFLAPLIAALAVLVYRNGTDILVTGVVFIGVLLFLVVFHELGHFTVAKLSGIKVLEFGVGIPPKAFGFWRGETEYTVNWLPLGGFVKMLGEEDPVDARSFAAQSAWKRLAVLVAGPGMNAILPIVLLTIALMIPRQVTMTDVVVVGVVPETPAASAGIQVGDIIQVAQGNEIVNSTTLQGAIQTRLGADMDWIIQRGETRLEVTIPEVRIDPPPGQGATGITLTNARVTVASVAPGSTADTLGLRAGDLFLRIRNSMIIDDGDAATVIASSIATDPTESVRVEVLRNGSYLALAFDPALGVLAGHTVDVYPEERRADSFFEAVPGAFDQLGDILVTFRNEIGRMISNGVDKNDFSGPLGIARITGEVAEAGLGPLVTWTALLSINLAIVNILPIPALDGGRIMFVLLELARGGRRIEPRKESFAHMMGFVFLIGMILLITANDIQRLISGTFSFG
jgi:regulator of sigma E protease